MLPATPRQKRLLAGDDDLRAPPLVLHNLELSHLQGRVQLRHLTHFVHRLPRQFTQRDDDQRAAHDPSGHRTEDHGLPGASEQTIERGFDALLHGLQVLGDDLFLVIA